MEYFELRMADETQQATDMFGMKKITPRYMPHLFRPGQLLLQKETGELLVGKQISKVTPKLEKQKLRVFHVLESDAEEDDDGPDRAFSATKWEVEVENLIFDGNCHKSVEFKTISFPDTDTCLNIADLQCYPLRFSSQSINDTLLERGRRFLELSQREVHGRTVELK